MLMMVMTFSNMVKEVVVVVVVGEMQKFLQTYLRIETGKPVKKKNIFFCICIGMQNY